MNFKEKKIILKKIKSLFKLKKKPFNLKKIIFKFILIYIFLFHLFIKNIWIIRNIINYYLSINKLSIKDY